MRARRRTQVVKGAVCKTAMQRFDPARRLQTSLAPFQLDPVLASHIERPVGADTFLDAASGLGQGETEQNQSRLQHNLSFGSQSFSLVESWSMRR